MGKVNFLPETPHTKGIINNISFMPWSNVCFVTAGSDHAVISWGAKMVHANIRIAQGHAPFTKIVKSTHIACPPEAFHY
jgi:hypothetical protein